MIKFFEIASGPCENSVRYDFVYSNIDDTYQPIWKPDLKKIDFKKNEEINYALINSKRLRVPLLRQGTQWKDCISRIFGSGIDYLIISQRVADALIRNKIKGFILYLTDIKINTYGRKRKPKGLDEYYIIIAAGRPLEFSYKIYLQYYIGSKRYMDHAFDAKDKEEYQYKKQIYLDKSKNILPTGGYLVSMEIPIMSSWDGSDFVPWEEGNNHMNTLYCSRRVVELAHEERWTNFSFKPISNFGLNDQRFEDMPWPPEIWPPNDKWAPIPPVHFVE